MKTYIAILRGINVSGKNSIKMDALKQMFLDFDFQDVKTYIQSGNVIFKSKESDNLILAASISNRIKERFGYDVPVIVMTSDELKEIVSGNPFARKKEESFLHYTFLSEKPNSYDLVTINSKKVGEEEIVITDKVVYLYCPHGYGKTKLTNTFLESSLKVTATTRNFKTANELLKIAE